jgi:hypothetical protein
VQQAFCSHVHLRDAGVGIRSGGERAVQLECIGTLLWSSARRLPSSSQRWPQRRMLQGSDGGESSVPVQPNAAGKVSPEHDQERIRHAQGLRSHQPPRLQMWK